MKEESTDSALQERFDAAIRVIRTIPHSSFQPSREMTLRFYGLYKQAMEGACQTGKPSFYEVEKSAKWHAWKAEENLSKEQAMEGYIEELKKIVEMMSLTPEVSDFLDKIGNFYELVNDEDKKIPPPTNPPPVRAALTNGTAKDLSSLSSAVTATTSKIPVNKPSQPLKRPLPPIIDATINDMLRVAEDDISEEELESEAFQDARSQSEWDGLRSPRSISSSASLLGDEASKGRDSLFQTLFPELEKLKKANLRMEQRADDHAQRLLALELKMERMDRQQNAMKSQPPVVHSPMTANANSNERVPRFLPENRIVRLLYRYWQLLESHLRQHPTLPIIAAALLPLILQLLSAFLRRITTGRPPVGEE